MLKKQKKQVGVSFTFAGTKRKAISGESPFYQPKYVDTELRDEIENDPELKAMLKQGEEDILAGRVVTTEELLEMISRGEI